MSIKLEACFCPDVMLFSLMKWISKKFHASAPGPAFLSNFKTLCGPQVRKLPTPALKCNKDFRIDIIRCFYDLFFLWG